MPVLGRISAILAQLPCLDTTASSDLVLRVQHTISHFGMRVSATAAAIGYRPLRRLQEELTFARGIADEDAAGIEASALKAFNKLEDDFRAEVEELSEDFTVSRILSGLSWSGFTASIAPLYGVIALCKSADYICEFISLEERKGHEEQQ